MLLILLPKGIIYLIINCSENFEAYFLKTQVFYQVLYFMAFIYLYSTNYTYRYTNVRRILYFWYSEPPLVRVLYLCITNAFSCFSPLWSKLSVETYWHKIYCVCIQTIEWKIHRQSKALKTKVKMSCTTCLTCLFQIEI